MWFRNIFRRPNNQPSTDDRQDLTGFRNLSGLPPSIYRQFDRLQLRASRHLRGSGAGLRPSTRRRPAAEFLEHRQYVPGDDVRFVDWKASARSEHIYLKQGEQPQETTAHILIDTSASMAWGNPPKSHAALSLAAAMGYLTLANEDRLQIIPLENPRSSASIRVQNYKGKAQFPFLLNHLRTLPFDAAQGKPFYGKTDLAQSLRDFSRSNARGGVVLILSDLLDAHDLPAALATLPRPTWEVTVFHLLHPHELNPPINGQFELVDSETGQSTNYDLTPRALDNYRKNLQTWRDAIELACIENKAFYTLIPTDWSLEKEVIPHLRKVRVLEPQ
jgi:uncharacterized protein (DUF58 family)